MLLALDAHRCAAPVQVGAAVPFGGGEVLGGLVAALDAAMALVIKGILLAEGAYIFP